MPFGAEAAAEFRGLASFIAPPFLHFSGWEGHGVGRRRRREPKGGGGCRMGGSGGGGRTGDARDDGAEPPAPCRPLDRHPSRPAAHGRPPRRRSRLRGERDDEHRTARAPPSRAPGRRGRRHRDRAGAGQAHDPVGAARSELPGRRLRGAARRRSSLCDHPRSQRAAPVPGGRGRRVLAPDDLAPPTRRRARRRHVQRTGPRRQLGRAGSGGSAHSTCCASTGKTRWRRLGGS